MSNEILTLVKDTSLARIFIALQEIIWAGQAFEPNKIATKDISFSLGRNKVRSVYLSRRLYSH